MRNLCAGLALALAGLGPAAAAAEETNLSVSGAWISPPPPGVEVAAAYLELHNRSAGAATLVQVTSPRCKSVEFHRSVVRNGVASMSRQDSVTIPAGADLNLIPGDYHLMLFRPSPPLQPGESVPLTFEFSDGTVLNAAAMVRRPEAADDAHVH